MGTSTNEFFYFPDLGAYGIDERTSFHNGLQNVDTRLGREYWVGDPLVGADFETAVATLDAANTVCYLNVGPGSHAVTSNRTVPKEITLVIHKGATVTVSDGIVLTVLGKIEAGNYAWFTVTSGGGTLRYYDGSALMRPTVNAVWFTNAGCGGSTSGQRWTGALNMGGIGEAVIKCNVGGRLKVFCPGGVYLATTEVLVQRSEVDIAGEGVGLNSISSLWVTGENVGGFVFGVDETDTYRNSLTNFGIYHPDSVDHGPALQLIENSSFTCYNVSVEGTSSNRWRGTGLEYNGWELGKFDRINIKAYQPIYVKINTKTFADVTQRIDFDRMQFNNCSLNAPGSAGYSLIKVDSGVHGFTNVEFKFLQCSGGQYLLYWDDSTSTAYSKGISFYSVKCESAYNNAGSYAFYINHNYQLSNLLLVDCDFSSFQNFAYLRKVLSTTIVGGYQYYSSGGKFIDAGDCYQICAMGPLVDSATTALTSSDMVEAFRVNGNDAAGGNFVAHAVWVSSDSEPSIKSRGLWITKNAAPADAALAIGECCIWYDSTNNKIMFKARNAADALKTGEVAVNT